MEIVVIAILITINALFVAAEFSLIRVRRTRIEQLMDEGSVGARRVHRLVSKPGRFLAVIQIGVTFVGFLAAAFAGATIVADIERVLASVALIAPQAGLIALLVVTAVVSLVTIVFGELVPKAVALAHAERLALLFAVPLDLLGRLLAPIVWLLTTTTQAITRLFGIDEAQQERVTAEELMILIERGGEQGVIEAEEQQMIGAVLELGREPRTRGDGPAHRHQALPATTPLDEIVETIVREGHSRIPIYEGTIDNVIGILYAKDLLPILGHGRDAQDQPACCVLRCSCPSRSRSTICCTTSSGAGCTSPSCSTSTAARPAWSRSRI